MQLSNVLWRILNITIPIIPIYLGIILYYKRKNIINTMNYIAIVFVSALIMFSCIKESDGMCQIIPIFLFIPLFILFIMHVLQKNMKDRGFHDKIITSFMIVLMSLYIIFWNSG
jgi:hypothetical protein